MLFTIWLVIAIATMLAVLARIGNDWTFIRYSKWDVIGAALCGIFWPVFIPFVILARLMA